MVGVRGRLFSFVIRVIYAGNEDGSVFVTEFMRFGGEAYVGFVVRLRSALTALLRAFVDVATGVFQFVCWVCVRCIFDAGTKFNVWRRSGLSVGVG